VPRAPNHSLWVMPASQQRVFLHVGTPKSGTTYLQAILWSNRERAAELGVSYPGEESTAQFHAAIDLQPVRYADWLQPVMVGSWDTLVAQVRAFPGTSVISMELLATAGPEQAAKARADLSFAEVHVICTARDLARQIPSAWQENVKTGQTQSFPEFLAAVHTGEPADKHEEFWTFQDAARMLAVWGDGLPPEHVHLVTVPPRGGDPSLLWQRFASVVGLDPTALDTDVPNTNTSLGIAETELIRRINAAIPEDVDWPRYETVMKEQVAEEILPAVAEMVRIALPEPDRPWVRARAEELVAALREPGYDVVGDLDELIPAPSTGRSRPAQATDSELLEVAVRLLANLVPRVPPVDHRPAIVEQVLDTLAELPHRRSVLELRRVLSRGKRAARRVLDRR
jgi:hypothetical protein